MRPPPHAAHNVSIPMRLQGHLLLDAVERSVAELVARHEVLRTRFEVAGGRPAQRIVPRLDVPCRLVDLRDHPPAERGRAARRLMAAAHREPFDLGSLPLLRLDVLRLDDEDHVVLLRTHHIITDAWSLGLVKREFAALYDACLIGEPAPLPALPIQYADYAVWQRLRLSGDFLAAELDSRERRIGDLPAGRRLFGREPPTGFELGYRQLRLGPEVVQPLRSLGAGANASTYMTLLAAFAVALARETGEQDLLFLTPVAGRTCTELESLLGFFVNRVLLRVRPSSASTFRALLAHVREVAADAFTHQEVPVEAVLRRLDETSPAPAIQVMLSAQNTPQVQDTPGGLRRAPLPPVDGGFEVTPILELYSPLRAPLDLSLVFVEHPPGVLNASVEFNTLVLDGRTVDRLVERTTATVARLVSAPDRPW